MSFKKPDATTLILWNLQLYKARARVYSVDCFCVPPVLVDGTSGEPAPLASIPTQMLLTKTLVLSGCS